MENPVMELANGMFALIGVLILCAASLTLLDWHLSRKAAYRKAELEPADNHRAEGAGENEWHMPKYCAWPSRASSSEIYGASVSMASSAKISSLSRKRILAYAQVLKTGQTPEAPAEEVTDVASRADDAERILSKPAKAGTKRRKKRWGQEATQVVLLGAVVIGGIAAILGLRYLSEMVGNNWIGN